MKGPKTFSGPQHRTEAQEAKVACVSLKPACESKATARDLGHLVWGLLHHTKLPKHTQRGDTYKRPHPILSPGAGVGTPASGLCVGSPCLSAVTREGGWVGWGLSTPSRQSTLSLRTPLTRAEDKVHCHPF